METNINIKAQRKMFVGKLAENFKDYRPISDEELAAWSAEIIDNYFYNMTTFEEFKAACKEVFEVDDVTEENFKSFVEEFENTYHTKNK